MSSRLARGDFTEEEVDESLHKAIRTQKAFNPTLAGTGKSLNELMGLAEKLPSEHDLWEGEDNHNE